ncbi:MAG: hypothetical protein ACI8PT_000390 [Gammaproteobacteria bacterium]|jgi:hypothetical protein
MGGGFLHCQENAGGINGNSFFLNNYLATMASTFISLSQRKLFVIIWLTASLEVKHQEKKIWGDIHPREQEATTLTKSISLVPLRGAMRQACLACSEDLGIESGRSAFAERPKADL